jgi:hypothetical protein
MSSGWCATIVTVAGFSSGRPCGWYPALDLSLFSVPVSEIEPVVDDEDHLMKTVATLERALTETTFLAEILPSIDSLWIQGDDHLQFLRINSW